MYLLLTNHLCVPAFCATTGNPGLFTQADARRHNWKQSAAYGHGAATIAARKQQLQNAPLHIPTQQQKDERMASRSRKELLLYGGGVSRYSRRRGRWVDWVVVSVVLCT